MTVIKKIGKNISGFKLFVPIIFICCLAGCGLTPQIFKINSDQLAKYDDTDKINLVVNLCLTDKFCNYTWDAPTGLPYTLYLGDSLCNNARILCKKLFQDVIVTNGIKDSVRYDVILTPEVVFLDKTQGAYSFQMVEIWERLLRFTLQQGMKGIQSWF
jgi:hypothetical protein